MFQSEKNQELDLNNPRFVVYINVDGKSHQSGIEYIQQTQNHLDVYKNATMWFVASKRDEIVCVYDGWGRVRDSDLKDLIEEMAQGNYQNKETVQTIISVLMSIDKGSLESDINKYIAPFFNLNKS
jgi:hypothetical protein